MSITDPVDGKLGLRLETAASVILRDMIKDHFQKFQFAIQSDRAASRAVVAAYVDGLSGALALAITARHGSLEDTLEATIKQLRDAVTRDLQAWEGRHAVRRT